MKRITRTQQQVKDAFTAQFKDLVYYSPLPGERELCQLFHVSRPTIRKVMDLLEQDGIVVRIQGRGSFYLGNKVSIDYSDPVSRGLGLSSALTQGEVISRVLQQDIELPTPKIAAYLNISERDMVFHLKRLRYINGVLYNLADDYIPLKICPELKEIDFSQCSLLKTLEEHNVVPCIEEKTIEVYKADLAEATSLDLEEGAPLFVTRIITYDAQSRIIQYAVSKADAYQSRFRVVSKASASENGKGWEEPPRPLSHVRPANTNKNAP